MLISAHDQNNAFYNGANTPWAHGWTSQQLVTSAIVTATGGTYELKAPVKPAESVTVEEVVKD